MVNNVAWRENTFLYVDLQLGREFHGTRRVDNVKRHRSSVKFQFSLMKFFHGRHVFFGRVSVEELLDDSCLAWKMLPVIITVVPPRDSIPKRGTRK